ncbi:Putative transketolase : dihydroxyacetone synthase (DAS), formaldehyde tranketolase involved in methanol metabolism [Podospora comata]|uniref:Transketolase n=1 Tax=Podospora comata TaxID=48703 RepID=A0ABY6S1G1_PODCO|nr:Putative transketolase : dihydroxyacetone synthase (DAS), formaldehyde tranketolase involved in methanol metabolism [Podospora comata]
MGFTEVDTKTINTIRVLAADATAHANSGHPGAPMGMAPVAHVLFNKIMRFNPKNPKWLNRDRFVLSNGHGCMLQYALLHLYGYALSIDDLKAFRTVDSITPGHPEAHDTPGIEVTTGPLGQGISNAVGLAMAQAHTAAVFNKPGYDLVDNYTYAFLGDGCLMEGVSSEACSLAGHLQLGNLIAVWDDNHITIDGDTNQAFTEDVLKRYESYGWHTITVEDGDNDLEGILHAFKKAQEVKDKPTLIQLKTIIGFGSKQQGTHGVHGAPLKADDIKQLKEKFGFDPEKSFDVPQEVYDHCHKASNAGAAAEEEWNKLFAKYSEEYKGEAADLVRRQKGDLPEGWEKNLPVYTPADAAVASRKLSEIVINKIFDAVPELVGGSADLTGSNLTRSKGSIDFQPPATGLGTYDGRYIRYGVREHGMGAIMNGLAAYGTIIPYGGTFLNFVSYAAGAVRLSALSQVRAIWVATHDSIGLGEDGPTHQPIEVLTHFRALPNCMVWRPADGNETSAAYYVALTSKHTPSIIALSRQNLPQLEGSTIEKAIKGGYVLHEQEGADITLVSTGSEVCIAIDAVKLLAEKHSIKARVVSLPCFEVFDTQPKDYQLSVLPDGIPSLSIEVMSTMGWEKYTHEQFGLNRFGASGPYKDVYAKFEFTPEGIAKRALQTIDFWKGVPVRSPINRAFQQIL